MNMKEAGWYVVFFKNNKPIADKVTQDTIDFLIKESPNFKNWFYSDKPFYIYGDKLENLKLVLKSEKSYKGVF